MMKTDLLTCHQDLVRGDCYYTLLYKLYCNMNVAPQYKVIGPYNYDRIIHNIKKYAKRQHIGQTSGKMHLILKIQICEIC